MTAQSDEGSARSTTGEGVAIDYAEVLRRLPHRNPFLLIDRAEAYVANTSIVGIKNVTFSEPWFTGHFPENPVLPGVLIIEALGQTGGLLMSKTLDVDTTGKQIFFTSVDSCRFRSPVRPGDTLRMEVEVLKVRLSLFKFKGRALVGSRVACEAEFAATLVEAR